MASSQKHANTVDDMGVPFDFIALENATTIPVVVSYIYYCSDFRTVGGTYTLKPQEICMVKALEYEMVNGNGPALLRKLYLLKDVNISHQHAVEVHDLGHYVNNQCRIVKNTKKQLKLTL